MLRIGSAHARTGRRGASSHHLNAAVVFQQLRSSSSSSSIPHFRPRQSFGAPLPQPSLHRGSHSALAAPKAGANEAREIGSPPAKTVSFGSDGGREQSSSSDLSHPARSVFPPSISTAAASASDWQCAECFFRNEASSESFCFGCGNAKPSTPTLSNSISPPLSSSGSTSVAVRDNQKGHAEEENRSEGKQEQLIRDGEIAKSSESNASTPQSRVLGSESQQSLPTSAESVTSTQQERKDEIPTSRIPNIHTVENQNIQAEKQRVREEAVDRRSSALMRRNNPAEGGEESSRKKNTSNEAATSRASHHTSGYQNTYYNNNNNNNHGYRHGLSSTKGNNQRDSNNDSYTSSNMCGSNHAIINCGGNQKARIPSVLCAADMARREARLQAQTDALIEHQSQILELRGRLYGDKSCERLNRLRASDEGNVENGLTDTNEDSTPHHEGRNVPVVAFSDDLHSGPTSLLCRQMGIRSRNSRLYLKEKILKAMRTASNPTVGKRRFSTISHHQAEHPEESEHNATSGDPASFVFGQSFPDVIEGLSYTDPSSGEPTAVVGLLKVTPKSENVVKTKEGQYVYESNPAVVGGGAHSSGSTSFIGANAHNFTSDMGIARLSSALTVYRRNKIEIVVDYISRWRERRELLGISTTNDDFGNTNNNNNNNNNNNKKCSGDDGVAKEAGEKRPQHILASTSTINEDGDATVPTGEEKEKEEANVGASTEGDKWHSDRDSVNVGGVADAPQSTATASDIYSYDDVLVSVVGASSAEGNENSEASTKNKMSEEEIHHPKRMQVADADWDALNESAWNDVVESECSSASLGWASSTSVSSSFSVPLSKAKEHKQQKMMMDRRGSLSSTLTFSTSLNPSFGLLCDSRPLSLPYTNEQETMAEDAVKAVIGADKRGSTRVLDFDTISWAAEGFVDSSEMLEQISRSRRCLSPQDRIFTVPCIVEKRTNITVRALSRNYSDYFVAVVNTGGTTSSSSAGSSAPPLSSPSSRLVVPFVTEVKFLMTRRMLRESGRSFYLRVGMPPSLDPLFIGVVARPYPDDRDVNSGTATNTWESAAAAFTPKGKQRGGSTHHNHLRNQANERHAAVQAIKDHLETNFELLKRAREQYAVGRRAEHQGQEGPSPKGLKSPHENLSNRDGDFIISSDSLLSPAASAVLEQLITNPTAFVNERFQTLADQKHRRRRLYLEMMSLSSQRSAASTSTPNAVNAKEEEATATKETMEEKEAPSCSATLETIDEASELASLKKAIAAADEVYDARVRGLIAMLVNASALDVAEDTSTKSHPRYKSSPFSVSMREKNKLLREAYSFLIEKYFGPEISIRRNSREGCEEEGQPISSKTQGRHEEVGNDGTKSSHANATDDDDYKAMMSLNATSPTVGLAANESESKNDNKIHKNNSRKNALAGRTDPIPEDEDGDMLVTPEELLDFDIRRAAVHQVMGSFERSSSNQSVRKKRGEADDDDYENDVDTIIISRAKKVDPLLVERRLARARELQSFPLHIMNTIKRLQNQKLKKDIDDVNACRHPDGIPHKGWDTSASSEIHVAPQQQHQQVKGENNTTTTTCTVAKGTGVEDRTNTAASVAVMRHALSSSSSVLPNDEALRRSELYAASQILAQRLNLKRLNDEHVHVEEGAASGVAASLSPPRLQHPSTGPASTSSSSSSPPELAVVMMASLSVPMTSVYINWRDTLRSSSAESHPHALDNDNKNDSRDTNVTTNESPESHSYSASFSTHRAHDKDASDQACSPHVRGAAEESSVIDRLNDDLNPATATNAYNTDHVASSLLCDDSLPSKAQLRELVVSELNPLLRWRCGACNLINVRPLIPDNGKEKEKEEDDAQTAIEKDPWSSVHHVYEDELAAADAAKVLLSVAVGKRQTISSRSTEERKQGKEKEEAAPFVAFREALDNALFGHDEDKRSFSLLADVKREMENKNRNNENTSTRAKINYGSNERSGDNGSVHVGIDNKMKQPPLETLSTSPSPANEGVTGIRSGSRNERGRGGGVPAENHLVVPASQPFPWKAFDLAALLKQQRKEAGAATKRVNAGDTNFSSWGNYEWGDRPASSFDSNGTGRGLAADISSSWAWGGDDNKTASAASGWGWGDSGASSLFPSTADTDSASQSSFLDSSETARAPPHALLKEDACRCYACGTLSTESNTKGNHNNTGNYNERARPRGVSRGLEGAWQQQQQYQGNEQEQQYGWHQQAVEGRRDKKWQSNIYTDDQNNNYQEGHHNGNHDHNQHSSIHGFAPNNKASWNPWDQSAANNGDNRSWHKMQGGPENPQNLFPQSHSDNTRVRGDYIPMSSANNTTTASTSCSSDFYDKVKKSSSSSTACGFAVDKELRTVSFVSGGVTPSSTEDIAAAIHATEMEREPLDHSSHMYMYHSQDDEAEQTRHSAVHPEGEVNDGLTAHSSSSSFWAGEGGGSSSLPNSFSPPHYEWKDLSRGRDQPFKTTSFGTLGSVGTGDKYGSVDFDNTRVVRDQVDQHLKYRKPRLVDVAPGTHDTMSEHEKVRRINLLLAGIADNVNVRQQIMAQKKKEQEEQQQQVDDDDDGFLKRGNAINGMGGREDSRSSAKACDLTRSELKQKRGYGRNRNSPPNDSTSASKVMAVLGADTIASGSTAAVVSLSERWKTFGQQTVYRPYHGFTNNSDIEKFSGPFSRIPTRFEEDIEADIQRRLPPHLREHKAVREARNAFYASYKPASSKLASTLFAKKTHQDDDDENSDNGVVEDRFGVAPPSPLFEDDPILPPRAPRNALSGEDNYR